MKVEITITKNINTLRTSLSDDTILKSLFDNVVFTSPRRCILNTKNEILIKNYGITKKHNQWIKSNSLLIGAIRWNLISDASFKIDEIESNLVYKFNIALFLLASLVSSVLFAVVFGMSLFQLSGNLLGVVKVGIIIMAVILFISAINIYVKYLIHKIFINRFVKEMHIKEGMS